ncbi:MAG: succinate dehydrogenase assembly factor 2 [Casimicrobiaceae bacterium]
MLSDTDYARLRWRARRGLLENDLVFDRLFKRRGADWTASEHAQLLRLLELDDVLLWDLIAGRSDDWPEGTAEMVALLRETLRNH